MGASNPELLEALQEAYRFISQPQAMNRETVTYRIQPYNALTAKIRSAIAKATGT